MSKKRYVVELSADERKRLEELIRKGKSPAKKQLKARILLRADESPLGPKWNDPQISEAVRASKILNVLAALRLIGDPSQLGKEDWANRWFLPMVEAARDNYVAQESSGDVIIFQSDEMVTKFVDPNLGWSALIKGHPRLYRIPGWHTDMFQDEGAALVARQLRPLLDRVDNERNQTAATGTASI